MAHDRKLVIGAVALVMGKVRNGGEAIDSIRNELEQILIESEWFPSAPFTFVSLILRYGNKNDIRPEFQRVSRKYNDLPLAIEVDMQDILAVHRRDKDKLKNIFGRATVCALIAAADKYNLPKQKLEEYAARFSEAERRHSLDRE
jgi:hypothetical protein